MKVGDVVRIKNIDHWMNDIQQSGGPWVPSSWYGYEEDVEKLSWIVSTENNGHPVVQCAYIKPNLEDPGWSFANNKRFASNHSRKTSWSVPVMLLVLAGDIRSGDDKKMLQRIKTKQRMRML